MYQSNTVSTPSSLLKIDCSRQFIDWLQEQQLSFAFTTYQTNRLFLIGVKPEGRISAFERFFKTAMGLYATSEYLIMSSHYQIWQFENILSAGETYKNYDRLYLPRIGYTTGYLDIHDLAVDSNQKIIFANTLYNCLATLSPRHSFRPLWKPPFVSDISVGDRCHLNGLAVVKGQPHYVTAVSQSNSVDGWREQRRQGGCIIHVPSNEIVLTGLSMPHSPRWYRGRLWVLNSGTGEFGTVNLEESKFESIAFCQGYARGLAFWDNFAIVGLSKPRDQNFSGLVLDEKLKHTEAQCGLLVIDLNTGKIVHSLLLEGLVTELYDVQTLPKIKRPMSLGFKTNEIAQLVTFQPLQNI